MRSYPNRNSLFLVISTEGLTRIGSTMTMPTTKLSLLISIHTHQTRNVLCVPDLLALAFDTCIEMTSEGKRALEQTTVYRIAYNAIFIAANAMFDSCNACTHSCPRIVVVT